MAPPIQKADKRPISFILHNLAQASAPVKVNLVIRPEDLSRPDVSRATVVQTLGGAWWDDWGPGLPSVQISGTTGWGGGNRPDGLVAFQELHSTIFKEWHKQRADAIEAGLDPEMVKLIFCDDLDEFTWVVLPQQFQLRRNKSRPLLSQYTIQLAFLADGVEDRATAEAELKALAPSAEDFLAGKDSFESALGTINSFVDKITGPIGEVLGPIQAAVAGFTALTAKALGFVNGVVAAGMRVVTSVTGPLLSVAQNMARAAGNVIACVQAIRTMPDRIKAEFQRVRAAFTNVFCLLGNIFKAGAYLPNYADLYGASTCSSTAGGSPISPYSQPGANPFPVLMPVEQSPVRMSGDGAQALSRLARMDAVMARPTVAQIDSDLKVAANGIRFQEAA